MLDALVRLKQINESKYVLVATVLPSKLEHLPAEFRQLGLVQIALGSFSAGQTAIRIARELKTCGLEIDRLAFAALYAIIERSRESARAEESTTEAASARYFAEGLGILQTIRRAHSLREAERAIGRHIVCPINSITLNELPLRGLPTKVDDLIGMRFAIVTPAGRKNFVASELTTILPTLIGEDWHRYNIEKLE